MRLLHICSEGARRRRPATLLRLALQLVAICGATLALAQSVGDKGGNLLARGSSPILQLWLDASDSSTITLSGSKVVQWRDKSSNGRVAEQLIDSQRPTRLVAAQNGRNTIEFDDVTQNSLVLNSPITADAYTSIAVKRRIDSVILLGKHAPNPAIVCWWLTDAKVYIYGNNERFVTVAAPTTAYVVFTTIKAPGVARAYLNGAPVPMESGPITATASNTYDRIGAGFGFYSHGDIAEFLFYTAVLSDADRVAKENALKTKWGISP